MLARHARLPSSAVCGGGRPPALRAASPACGCVAKPVCARRFPAPGTARAASRGGFGISMALHERRFALAAAPVGRGRVVVGHDPVGAERRIDA